MHLEKLDRLASDRSLFVCRDSPDGDAARFRGNSLCSLLIGGGIEDQTEPGAFLADTSADLGCVFADPGRENQAIKPTKCRDQGSQLTDNPIYKQIDGLRRRAESREASNSRMSLLIPETPRSPLW